MNVSADQCGVTFHEMIVHVIGLEIFSALRFFLGFRFPRNFSRERLRMHPCEQDKERLVRTDLELKLTNEKYVKGKQHTVYPATHRVTWKSMLLSSESFESLLSFSAGVRPPWTVSSTGGVSRDSSVRLTRMFLPPKSFSIPGGSGFLSLSAPLLLLSLALSLSLLPGAYFITRYILTCSRGRHLSFERR